MPPRRRNPRQKDLTSRYLAGQDDRIAPNERFSPKHKHAQHDQILRTSLLRADDQTAADIQLLPIGQVVQVYSIYCEIEHESALILCVTRKTLNKLSKSAMVVGDYVRFRLTGAIDSSGRPEAIIEQVLPRQTVLTRADSFNATTQQPIVANAQQMLIVASVCQPRVKWGLIDRMLVAASSGGLRPILCLNKIDLLPETRTQSIDPAQAMAHYAAMGIATLHSSVTANIGLDALRQLLRDRVTVLAGHSGVGKSTLINAIQPQLALKTAAISAFNDKGRHTTTSARRHRLDFGGQVIDTPGVKLFGLWNITPANLIDHFPDIQSHTAPPWRQESYEKIKESLSPA